MMTCTFVVVGDETDDNLRLSKVLKKIHGKERVARFLELRYLEPFLAENRDSPIIICLDLFSFDLQSATETVGRVRDAFPKVVFNLYLDHDEYMRRLQDLPDGWQARFQHYYKTYKEPADVEFEPIVRGSLAPSEWEALYNVSAVEPIRLTPAFQKGLVESATGSSGVTDGPTAFVSYSRRDWEGFVSLLVSNLTRQSQRVWIDQDFIQGGDDWMDAIGKALQECDTLLLVLSPDALGSRYVKTEYRYFIRQDKPVIPLLWREVEQLPFELATLQYIDFTRGETAKAHATLLALLARQRSADRGRQG